MPNSTPAAQSKGEPRETLFAGHLRVEVNRYRSHRDHDSDMIADAIESVLAAELLAHSSDAPSASQPEQDYSILNPHAPPGMVRQFVKYQARGLNEQMTAAQAPAGVGREGDSVGTETKAGGGSVETSAIKTEAETELLGALLLDFAESASDTATHKFLQRLIDKVRAERETP